MYLNFECIHTVQITDQPPMQASNSYTNLTQQRYFDFGSGTLLSRWRDVGAKARFRMSLHHFEVQGDPITLNVSSNKQLACLLYILEGTAKLQIEHTTLHLRQGKYYYFMIGGSLKHSFQVDGRFRAFHLDVDDTFLAQILEPLPNGKKWLDQMELQEEPCTRLWYTGTVTPGIKRILAAMISEPAHTPTQLELNLIARTHYLIQNFGKYLNKQGSDCMLRQEVRKNAEQFIKDNLSNPQLIIQLSAHLCMSIRSIERLFSLEKDKLAAFIRQKRMMKAAKLLCSTDEPIANIAEQLNLGSPSNFSRSFFLVFKKTPSAYRIDFKKQAGRDGYTP